LSAFGKISVFNNNNFALNMEVHTHTHTHIIFTKLTITPNLLLKKAISISGNFLLRVALISKI
jgi:hypothetical protein